MTISNPSVRAGPFYPNGVTFAFPFGFLALSAGELLVTQVVNGVEVAMTGWSAVLNAAGTEGGTILFGAPPAAGGGAIYINANPNFTQTVTGQVALLPSTVVAALDRLTQLVLVLQQRVPTQAAFNAAIDARLATAGVLILDKGTGA